MQPQIYSDSRFWEIFNEKGESLGIHMYGDMIEKYSICGKGVLSQSYSWLHYINYTWKIIGDIKPLEEDSDIPVIQKWKIKERLKEKRRNDKYIIKKGFKLDSKLRFGKHSGSILRDVIIKYPSYYSWLSREKILLLHPEVIEFAKNLIK